jgi:hypothetical protein
MSELPPPTNTDFRQIVGDTLYIYAVDLHLTQADILYSLPDAGGKFTLAPYHIRIQADTVTLKGSLINRGRNFSLVARRILIGWNPSIDISGPDPTRDFLPGDSPQQQDTSPGATGTKGEDADDGLPAGALEILAQTVEMPDAKNAPIALVIQNGGRGGRGQDGAQGMQGAIGDDGIPFNVPQNSWPSFIMPHGDQRAQDWCDANVWGADSDDYGANYGKTGGAGGRGGSGGRCGKGGDGGQFVYAVILDGESFEGFKPFTDEGFVREGTGGQPSTSKGGQGGKGGGGGRGAYVGCQLYQGTDEDYFFVGPFMGRTNTGQTGATGLPGDDQQGTPGTPGSTQNLLGPRTDDDAPRYDKVAPFVDVELLLLTQRAAKLAYLKAPTIGDYQTPAQQFSWLANITESVNRADLGLAPEVREVWKTVNASAKIELSRFSQGLDFFGHVSNWTPTLTMNYVSSALDTLLPLAKSIEDDYDKFMQQGKTAIERRDAYTSTRDNLTQIIKQFQDMQQRLQQTIDTALKAVEAHDEDIGLQKQRITDAKEVFNAAWADYVRKETQCSLSDVLDALKAVVTFGEAAYKGASAVTDAFKSIKALGMDLAKFKNVVEKVEKVTDSIDSIREGWGKAKTAITIANPDGGKIAIEEKDFDKAIKPYMDKIPAAAGALKEAVDHYLDLIKSRNTLVLNYNSLFIKKADLEKQVAQRTAELNHVDVEFQRDSGGDVTLPVYLSFMQQAYSSVRDYALWLIYLETRAYEYWSLTETQLELSDVRISFLDSSHTALKEQVTEAMMNTHTLNSAFQGIEVVVNQANNASTFAGLPSTKKLTLSLEIDDPTFADHYDIRTNAVTVQLSDNVIHEDAGTLNLRLHHNGNSSIKDANQVIKTFTHEPLTVGFTYDYKNKVTISAGTIGDEAAGYANLSPFTQWTIDFDLAGNEWLDLTKLDEVKLTFSGSWKIQD